MESARGIVIVGGGKYLPSVYVTVRVLRHVGCTLPVEVWHFEGEDDARIVSALREYDVEFMNADEISNQKPFRFLRWHWWKGWQLKSFALLNTTFREVLFLDADCYPNCNPEYLFDWPEYREKGVVIWPDLKHSPTTITKEMCQLFQIEPPTDRLAESGQMLVDRKMSWRHLYLAGFYNQSADITYRYVWGDKDTFPFAWKRIGTPYGRMWPECQIESDCILQLDYNGYVIFQHRVSDKFKTHNCQFDSTPQQRKENLYHKGLAHESFCFYVLNELNECLAGEFSRKHNKATQILHCASTNNDRNLHKTGDSCLVSPQSIDEMYPRVPVELLVSSQWQQKFEDLFLSSGEFDADLFEIETRTIRPQRKCISVSVFKQNVNNRFPGEFAVDEENWRSKYWNGLKRVIDEMPGWREWKIRIHIERDLWDEAFHEFASHPQVELVRMRVNSVGASPGMLWRFMTLADLSLDMVLETDIDELLVHKLDYIRSFEMDEYASIGRIGGFESARDYFVAPNESDVKNYATMIGSCVMSRPSHFDFDLIAAMRGFMAFRRCKSTSDRPWAFAEDDEPNAYNQPIGGHVFGWGSHWYMYGFDERFLKHVLYYHFAEKGKLHTWAPSLPPARIAPEGLHDLKYIRMRGNTTVNPHNAIRLVALDLPPVALRIAFVLEEYRWIFETLLKIMCTHSQTGFCGNVFFHRVEEPFFLELVPKQLNLYNAARSASKVLELGFNAGHSAATMLLSNPRLTVRAFDTCGLDYTKPCFEFLNSIFDNRITLVEGQSQSTVASDDEYGYDLLHVDADHSYLAVAADLANALPKCVNGSVVIMDDYEPANEVEQATRERMDLVPTDRYTLRETFPGSSHAFFHYQQPTQCQQT